MENRISELEIIVDMLVKTVFELSEQVYYLQNPKEEVILIPVMPGITPTVLSTKRFKSVKAFMETLWKDDLVVLNHPSHYFHLVWSPEEGSNILEYHHPDIIDGFDHFGIRADFRTLAEDARYPMLGAWMKEQFGREWGTEWYETWGELITHRSWPGYNIYTGMKFIGGLGCKPAKVNGLIKK